MAKVVRDRMIMNGKFNEMQLNQRNHSMKIGSGYPSDPICKEWINNDGMIDPVFTFPNIVRFSWAPIKKLIQQKSSPELRGDDDTSAIVVPITFVADIENDDEKNDSEKHKILIGMKRQQEQMNIFLGKNKGSTGEATFVQKRLQYFERRKLQPVTKL